MYFKARYSPHWMDSPTTQSPSISQLDYAVSTRFDSAQKRPIERPIFIAVHGFSATPYEWLEFKDYAETHSKALVSLILMGGHGRDLEAFKAASWQDWGAPILKEYYTLKEQGYRHIHFIAASAGATVLLNFLAEKRFIHLPEIPCHIFLIDPFINPQSSLFKWTPILSRLIRYFPASGPRSEAKHMHYYSHYPSAAIRELYKAYHHIHRYLKRGFELSKDVDIHIYQADQDSVVDPDGAKHLYHALSHHGVRAQYTSVHSANHVFLHGASRAKADWTDFDSQLQKQTFDAILDATSSTRT